MKALTFSTPLENERMSRKKGPCQKDISSSNQHVSGDILYIHVFKQLIDDAAAQSSQWMDRAVSVLTFASQALHTNFFGLACPIHCSSFPLSSFVLAAVLGWIGGVISVCLVLLFLLYHHHLGSSFTNFQPTHPSATRLRLLAYLNERGIGRRGSG